MRVESTNTKDVDGEPCLTEHRVLCEELEQLMKVEGLGLYHVRDSIEVSVWTVYAQATLSKQAISSSVPTTAAVRVERCSSRDNAQRMERRNVRKVFELAVTKSKRPICSLAQ